jgi:hypothetical protein
MATNTIIVVTLIAVAAVLLLIVLGLLLALKCTERRRVQAWLIRDITSEQPREARHRRALAEENAAPAHIAEADQRTREAFDSRPVHAVATQAPEAPNATPITSAVSDREFRTPIDWSHHEGC